MKKPSTILSTMVAVLCTVMMVFVSNGYAASKTNTVSGNWSAAATWGGALPNPGDDITIATGTTVVMDSSFSMASLTIQSTGTLQFDNMGYGRTVTVTGNIAIDGQFISQGTGTFQTVHSLYISGNLSVTGTLNFAFNANKGYCNTYFINTSVDQTITGGGTVQFRGLILAKGGVSRKVTANFDVTVNGLPISFTQSPANPSLTYGGTYEQSAGILYHNVPEYVPANGKLLFSGSGGMEKWQYELNINGGALEVNTSGIIQIGTTRSNVGLYVTGGTADFYAGTVNVQGQMQFTGGTTTLHDGPTINIDPQALAAASPYNLPATQNAFEISGTANFSHTGSISATISILNPIRLTGSGREISVSGSGSVDFDHTILIAGIGTPSKSGGDGFEISNTKASFFDLTVNTGASASTSFQGRDVSLVTDISVSHSLTITSGKIVTSNSWTVTLEGTATVTETPGFEVWGRLTTTRTLTANSSNSFGGIGVTISIPAGPGNPGSTVVFRKTGDALSGLVGQSILRYFDITPSGNNTGLNAGMVFSYNDNGAGLLDLNQSETNFRIYKSTNLGSTWTGFGSSVPDYALNTVTIPNGINDLSRWTVSGSNMGPIITSTALTSSLNPACAGNSVTFTATLTPAVGPTGTIQFYDGATPLGSPVALLNGQVQFTTSILSVGTHTITAVYSGDGTYATSTSAPVSEVVNSNPVITLVGKTDVLCNGNSTGAIDISVSSGSPAYTYHWSPGGATTQNLANVVAGTYFVTVTDANNCTATGSWTLTQPSAALAITLDSKTDITCFGQSNGEIEISVSGGTQPYSYHWSPGGATTEDRSNLVAGSYSVTVTDAHQCTAIGTWTITQPAAALAITLNSKTDVTCFGLSNGAINLTVNGGTPAYAYHWSPGGATTQNLSNLVAGTYSLTVTDAHQCSTTGSWIVTQPAAALVIASSNKTDVQCFGNSTGAINITVSGGTTPYAYMWSPGGATTQNLANIVAGTYSVTITDAHSCTTMGSWIITQPPAALALTLAGETDIACHGNSTGAISINVSGGTPGYSYHWSPGGMTTQNLTGLLAGSYSVTVTDAHQCTATNSWTLTQPSADLTIALDNLTNVQCHGNSTGSIEITVNGGTSPYTYLWSPGGATTEDRSGLAAGTYFVTVTDAHQCTATGQWTITQPASALVIASSNKTDIQCFGNNTGAISITVSGGTPSYTYLWSPGGATTQDLTNLIAGTYSVTVTDAHSCTTTELWTLTQPAAALALSLTSKTDIACHGNSTGAININVSGGTPGYTYHWSPGGMTTQNLSDLIAGTYAVTVTDAHQCTATNSWTLTQPSANLAITLDDLQNIQCHGNSTGEIDITVNGGTPPYTYHWSPGGSTSEDRSDLIAGTYFVTVTDAHLCTATGQWTITQPAAALVIASSNKTDVQCHGNSNGAIDITVSGGTPAYTYHWSPGGATTQNLTNLIAGTYAVTITDAHSCTTTQSWTITQPAADLTITLNSKTNVQCFGMSNGAIDISVSGGTPNYTYHWSPGDLTTEDLTNLVAGIYSLTVTDAHQCTATGSWTITEPTALTLSGTPTPVSCYGLSDGGIVITAGGGTPGYTYNWSPTDPTQGGVGAGLYSVTVTDVHNCTIIGRWEITQPTALTLSGIPSGVSCYGGTNGLIRIAVGGGTQPYTYLWDDPNATTDQDLLNVPAGTYTVIVTDNNGCQITDSWVVTQPPALVVSLASKTDIQCHGMSNGAINISVTGGTSGYSYFWSPGGATTQNLSNLTAGTYFVTVTDAHQCTTTGNWTLTQPSAVLSATLASKTDISCFGNSTGAIDINVNGGTPNYSYFWSPGGATTQDLTNLTAGTYSVTVTDAHLCTTTGTWTITQPAAALVIASSNAIDVQCHGNSTGSISITVSGGTLPYAYVWSPGGGTTQNLSNLPAGTYSVIITDAHSCTTTGTWTITQPAADLTISLNSKNNVQCFGMSNGAIDITVSGGTTPYAYYWTPGDITTQNRTDLIAGTYAVTVTDAHQCVSTGTWTITQPTALTLTAIPTNVSCYGLSDGSVTITAGGGTPGYTYHWSPTDPTLGGVGAGTYSVTVTDVNLCTITGSWTLTQPTALTLTSQFNNISCFGVSDGNIYPTIGGGTPPYGYQWDDPNQTTDQNLLNVPAGTYNLVVTDDHGCLITGSWVITQPSALTITLASKTNVQCFGMSNGAIDISVSGGTTPYAYYWTPGDITTQNRTDLIAGTYAVTVTDAHQCVSTGVWTITQPTALTLTAIPTNVSCYGLSDGSVTITAGGGTPGYTYDWSPTDPTLGGVGAGTYSVTVTDVNLCTITGSWTLTQPTALTLTSQFNSISCFGVSDGNIYPTIGGGTPPYGYQWDDPNQTTDQNLLNVPAGTYNLVVTDDHGCLITGSWVITQPSALTITLASKTNVQCFGMSNGTIDISVSGGTTPYAYYWTPGDITTQNRTDLIAGTYAVTVTDAHQCVSTGTWTITQPTALTLTAIPTNVSCYGLSDGSVTITAGGGTPGYTYDWSPTDPTLGGVGAGTYSVTVTDVNLCTITGSWTLTQPTALTLTSQFNNISCFGVSDGNIYPTIGGGTPPYGYQWDDPNQTTDQNLLNVPAGTYNLVVTDDHGCLITGSWVITQPPALTITLASKTNVQCFGMSNGAIDITVSGGTTPYAYYWTPGDITTQNRTDLIAGTYAVTVTDAHQCVSTGAWTITQPTALTLTAIPTNVSCYGLSDGSVTITAGGGTPGYTYHWSPMDPTLGGVGAGTYSVTVTDVNLCTITGSWTLTQPTALTMGSEITEVSCNGGSNGNIYTFVSGGTPPYGYQWDDPNSSTDANLLNVPAGTYSVLVTDDHGCQITGSWVITQPPALTLDATITGVTCFSGSDGSIDITVGGGTPCMEEDREDSGQGYRYFWSPGGMTWPDITNLTAGTYSVTVTDCNQCTITGSFVVTAPTQLTVGGSPTAVSCHGGSDGSITTTVNGGSPTYSYLWSPGGETTPNLTAQFAGTYTVTVTDSHNCTVADSWVITEPGLLAVTSFYPTSVSADVWGLNGFTLQVFGTGFKPTDKVFFSETPDIDVTSGLLGGVIHFISSTELDVVFPPGSGFATILQESLTYQIEVEDTACNQESESQNGFEVIPGAAAFLVWEGNGFVYDTFAGDDLSGYLGPLTVDVQDSWGYIVTAGSYDITMRLIQGTGTLASYGTGVHVMSTSGIAEFPDLWINLAGTDKILQPYSGSFGSWPSTQFIIYGTYADHMGFTTEPGPPNPATCPTSAHAGSPFPQQPVVQAFDQYGNPTGLGLPANCELTLAPALGTLLGTSTKPFDVNGAAIFTDLQINLAGTNKLLVAHAGVFTDVNSSLFTICSGAAAKLVFAQQPIDARAGDDIAQSAGGIKVKLQDNFGNDVFDNGIDVNFPGYPVPGGPGTLSSYGFGLTQLTVNGVATFVDLYIDLVGTYHLLPSSPLHPALTADPSDDFVITPNDPYMVMFEPFAEPTNTPSSEPISPPVQASRRDQFGNYIPESGFPLDMSIFSGPGSLYGTTTQNTDAGGVATFDDLSIDLVGTYVLNVHDASLEIPGPPQTLPDDQSTPFEIIAGSAAQVVFYGPIATPITAGDIIYDGSGPGQFEVWLVDAAYNLVNQSGTSIYVTLYYGTGALSGTDTKPTTNGIATFDNLWLNLVGYKRLQARSGSLGSDISNLFVIDAAAASQLTFTTQPRRTKVNTYINGASSYPPTPSNVVVAVQDQYGNTVPGSGTNITMSLLTGTGLGGTLTQATNLSGVATFNDLTINTIGYYNLVATSSSFTRTSNLFYISITKENELEPQPAPKDLVLKQNYPNPFNPTTTIEYSVPELSKVRLSVYDMLGNEVAVLVNDQVNPGNYQATWSAGSLKSGMYLYRIQAESLESGTMRRDTKRMILMK